MTPITVNIADEFSPTPGLRSRDETPFSGQQFREEILEGKYNEAREMGCSLIVELDGTAGLAPSFLEEAFGGLVRKYPDLQADIVARISFVCTEERYLVDEIREFIKDANAPNNRRKITLR